MKQPTTINPTGPARFGLIIGAAKCGTTSLFSYLQSHPQICGSRVKEPEFFVHEGTWKTGPSGYRQLWDWDAETHLVAMEASTSYTKMPRFPHVPERIAQIPGDFRFVYLMRDPVARIESHYTHAVHEPSWSGDKSLAKWLPYMIDVSRYAYQLDRFESVFGADRLLLIDTDDLARDSKATLRQISRHFSVDSNYEFGDCGQRHNTNRDRIANPYFVRLARHRVGKKVAGMLPKGVRQRILRTLGLTRRTDNLHLSESDRARVRDALRADMLELRDRYGVDVSRWGFR